MRANRIRYPAALALICLGGCVPPKEVIRVQEVPVMVSCVTDDPARPRLPDHPCQGKESAECVKIIAAHIERLETALDSSNRAIQACRVRENPQK